MQQPHIKTNKPNGFTIVEIVILLVVLSAIGVGVWWVWQGQGKNVAYPNAVNGTAKQEDSRQLDSYEDWKTYCDDANKACFRYPADWSIEPSHGDGRTSARAVSPTGDLAATYNSPDNRDGHAMTFYAASIEDLDQPNSRYKVVGGYTPGTSNSVPGYRIVDAELASSLTLSKESLFPNTARFTVGGESASLEVSPLGEVFSSDSAKSWFDLERAKTALSIARSFYFQP